MSDRAGTPWRSLDELADTPEFREFARKEFPGFANVWEGTGVAEGEGFDRRQFLALSAAALGLAGLAGCRRPDLEILPYTAAPTEAEGALPTPGLPSYYATTVPMPGGGFPVLVESHEGRPTKVEGHPLHPASRGATDAHVQASILDLYNPDRSRTVVHRPERGGAGDTSTLTEFDNFAAGHFAALRKADGKGLRFLAEDVNSPALRMIQEHLKKTFPQSVWHAFEPVGGENAAAGTRDAFGKPYHVSYNLDRADVIVALDSDFLSLGESAVAHQLAFARRRRLKHEATVLGEKRESDAMNRLYAVESNLTVTGTAADHRLRLPAAHVLDYAVLLAREVLPGRVSAAVLKALGSYEPAVEVPPAWVSAVADDLRKNIGRGLVLAGDRQPPAVHVVAHLINEALGNNGRTVEFRHPAAEPAPGLAELVAALRKGEVETLVVLGGNPAATAPADYDFAALVRSVKATVRLGLFDDETSRECLWHVPAAHFLESWGDCETGDGTYSPVQPLIAPLFSAANTVGQLAPAVRSPLELLIQISDYDKAGTPALARAKAVELVKASFVARSGKMEEAADRQLAAYRRFLHEGWLPNSTRLPAERPSIAADVAKKLAAVRPPKRVAADNLELAFAPCYRVYDGRHATNGWLQELPDPITKLVWDNAALVSPHTAELLGVRTGDLITLTVPGRPALEIAAFVLPGHADHSITVTLGHGRIGEGQPLLRKALQGSGGGFDVYPLRTSANLGFVSGVQAAKTGRRYRLVTTQDHGSMEGRDIIRVETIDEFRKKAVGHGQEKAGGETKPHAGRLPLHLAEGTDLAETPVFGSVHQWGMVIDLNTCTGCSACVIACQAENNIPVVGKDEVRRGREMHWIRLDRYFIGNPADPQVAQQPLACVHCEQAPCETVCPVNAAVHSPEGLNLQVYNRCIGTRYCSNNCPYKVRRFNWFDYNRRPLDQLRLGPLVERVEPETLKMQRNPDVTVRMRGVMEKCTYCVQRIERAKIGVKLKATREGSTNFAVPDGLITPACAQACPSKAIVFGNLNQPDSRVAKLRDPANPRNYRLLEEIHTRPRTSYLARLRNPNPAMAATPEVGA
jgi:molybdopterin-containing oxidoreductase family iron-sulfur binding subunit